MKISAEQFVNGATIGFLCGLHWGIFKWEMWAFGLGWFILSVIAMALDNLRSTHRV